MDSGNDASSEDSNDSIQVAAHNNDVNNTNHATNKKETSSKLPYVICKFIAKFIIVNLDPM